MSITKVFLGGIVALCFSATFNCSKDAGTGPTNNADAQAVAADKSALAITYAAIDNANSVTLNIGLPASGANGSSVSWVTSNSSRITVEGTVTRPAIGSIDVVVTLTATISKGTASDVKVFSVTVKAFGSVIIDTGTVTDIDGNDYKTVKIGNQEWMAENLRVTKYNDGSAISLVTDSAAWNQIYSDSLTTPAFCYYGNTTNADSIKKFGALYNWNAVDTKKLAPAGWHVPSDSEWTIMEYYLGVNGYTFNGEIDTTHNFIIAKSLAAKTDWSTDTTTGAIGNDLTKNNRSGFSALPSGCRYNNKFSSIGSYCVMWTATIYSGSIAFNRRFQSYSSVSDRDACKKAFGCSVRLIRD